VLIEKLNFSVIFKPIRILKYKLFNKYKYKGDCGKENICYQKQYHFKCKLNCAGSLDVYAAMTMK
jgi:hypothetical protein